MILSKIRKNLNKIDGAVKRVHIDVKAANQSIKEGRANQDYKERIKNESMGVANSAISQAKDEIQKELMMERARANDLVKRSDHYNARVYNLQLAQVMAEGKQPAELIQIYKNLNHEQIKHKEEYERIFSIKIDDGNYIPWQKAIDENKTWEERESLETIKRIELVEGFLPTLNGQVEHLLELAADGVLSGDNIDVFTTFEAIEANVERRVHPEEMARQEAEQLREKLQHLDNPVNPYDETHEEAES